MTKIIGLLLESASARATGAIVASGFVVAALIALPVRPAAAEALKAVDIRAAIFGEGRVDAHLHGGIDQDHIYAALAGYVRSIGGQVPAGPPVEAAAPADAESENFSDLRAYAGQLLDKRPKLARIEKQNYTPVPHRLPDGHPPIEVIPSDDSKQPNDPFLPLQKASDIADLEQYAQTVAPQSAAPKAKPARVVKPPLPDGGAAYIGTEACMQCHSSHAAEFAKTVMGRIAKTQKGKMECETCHGPGSAHVKAGGGRGVGGIRSLKPGGAEPVAEINAVCLNCHEKGARTYWKASTHETRGLACTNCHTVMKNVSPKGQFVKSTEMETCFQCHQQKRAQLFRSSHMPLREGKMTCSDCHNPHGTSSESLLKKASINDTCYTCHAEKRGPFLWEHAPVRENCLNCHDAHGSNHAYMLNVSRPRLCTQCHTEGGHQHQPRSPTSVYAFNASCVNCHSAIHGSNSPAGARLQR